MAVWLRKLQSIAQGCHGAPLFISQKLALVFAQVITTLHFDFPSWGELAFGRLPSLSGKTIFAFLAMAMAFNIRQPSLYQPY
jgi:hypothetical protein